MNETQTSESNRITSKQHRLYIQKTVKKSLCNFDNKIRLKSCGIHIAMYGSKESDDCECAFAKCVKYEKQV